MQVRSVQRLPIEHFGQRFSPSVEAPYGLSGAVAGFGLRSNIVIVRTARTTAAARPSSKSGSDTKATFPGASARACAAYAAPLRRGSPQAGQPPDARMPEVSETAASPGPDRSSPYRLTEEQEMLRDAVRVLADERVAP